MEIRSILQISTVLLGCLSLYLFLIQVSTPNLRGIGWVSLGYAATACGTLLMSLRGQISDTFSVVLANTLLPALTVGFYWGISELLCVGKRRRWLLPASLVPAFLLHAYFTLVNNQVDARTLVHCGLVVIQCFFIMALLLRNESDRTLLPRRTLSLVLGTWIRFQSWRICLAISAPASGSLPSKTVVLPQLMLIPVLCAVIAGLSFIWLAMAQLHYELELLSQTDELTGLLNRRALERFASREIAIARRRKTPLSLILLDLDRFKVLNDNHGHTAGDAALVSTARSLAAGLREIDLLARFGGEEFVILLPDATQNDAFNIAERLRSGLEALCIHHQRKQLKLSASFGVTTLMPDDLCMEQIIQRGDIALYQAKHNGRNQVVAL